MERFAALQRNHAPGLAAVSAYRHGGGQAISGEEPTAKPSVHSATRDELVEAGVRAELADEILKRRRKGAIRLEELEEVPGVGPATLEQLRQALDFREQQQPGSGNGGNGARANEQQQREQADQRARNQEGGGNDERRREEEAPARTVEAAAAATSST